MAISEAVPGIYKIHPPSSPILRARKTEPSQKNYKCSLCRTLEYFLAKTSIAVYLVQIRKGPAAERLAHILAQEGPWQPLALYLAD